MREHARSLSIRVDEALGYLKQELLKTPERPNTEASLDSRKDAIKRALIALRYALDLYP